MSFGFQGGGFTGVLPSSSRFYGSFFDTTDQSCPSPNVGYAMRLNNTDVNCTSGFVIQNNLSGQPTQIKALNGGVYNLQFSSQFYRLSGGSKEKASIWIRVNGIDIPATNSHIDTQSNSVFFIASWNWYVKLNAGDYVEIIWAVTSIAITIQFDPASPPYPATPSVIATIEKVN